jgi:hypothetical protein
MTCATIRLSKNFVYDVLAHFSVNDVVALNSYNILGGVPDVLLEAANSALPETLKNRLARMTASPA